MFWRLTPRELHLILKGDGKRRSEDLEAQRALNNELARLVSFAFHDPKKMPDYKPLRDRKAPEVSSEIDEARVRAFFIGLATRGT